MALMNEEVTLPAVDARTERAPGTLRKVLFAGVGGSGTAAVTYIKAKELAEFGRVRPGLAFLAFDVMPDPPVVTASMDGGGTRSVSLEPQREYMMIGAGLDPPHLSYTLRRGQGTNDDLRWLLDQQPGGRFVKTLEKGTEGERAYGYAAYLWSEDELEDAVAGTLRRLNDVRLADGTGGRIAGVPVDVFVTGSDAGGVGSAVALPLCGLIKRTMHRVGMSVHRSFFTYLVIGPEAFPETTMRLANACGALGDLAVAQAQGVIP